MTRELGPEGFGLAVADDFPAAVLDDTGGDHDRLGNDAVVDAGLDVRGAEEQA